MHPEDELEEALLIAAFRKRQYIEVAKVQAIITAVVNPSKAAEAYGDFVKLILPEYDNVTKHKDQIMIEALEREKNTMFELSQSASGWSAHQSKIGKE